MGEESKSGPSFGPVVGALDSRQKKSPPNETKRNETKRTEPRTIAGMLWLDGRRRMHEAIKIGKSSDSTMWQSFPDNL
jgi:hypothetical protein